MIRHIVFFSATAANLDEVESGLWRLGDIPASRHFEVSRNARIDLFANEIDLVVYAEFADAAALAAYKAHPIYAEVTAAVRPLREMRFAIDYEVPARAIIRD